MELPADIPSPETFRGIMTDLKKALADVPKTRERLMSLTGEAWSGDGMVKVQVGPRGQLVDLEIDPRVFRKPDSQALRASILDAANAAVAQVLRQVEELVQEQMPPELAELRARYDPEGLGSTNRNLWWDANVVAERRREQDELLP
jgi:DNA-binding protein YbaB